MKRVLSLVLTLVLLVSVLAGCGTIPAPAASSAAPTPVASSAPSKEAQPSPKPQEDQIVLRLAENQPADYPTTLGDLEFARLVEERTNGRIKIEVYGAQLGDEKRNRAYNLELLTLLESVFLLFQNLQKI